MPLEVRCAGGGVGTSSAEAEHWERPQREKAASGTNVAEVW